jgi:hypothetical protein
MPGRLLLLLQGRGGRDTLGLQREALRPAELPLERAFQGEKIERKQTAQNRRLRPPKKQVQKTPRRRVLNVPGGSKGHLCCLGLLRLSGSPTGIPEEVPLKLLSKRLLNGALKGGRRDLWEPPRLARERGR